MWMQLQEASIFKQHGLAPGMLPSNCDANVPDCINCYYKYIRSVKLNFKISISLLIILGVYSCKTSKMIELELKKTLQVESAFIQKEVPGIQGEKAKTYLTLKFSEESFKSVQIDSIKIVGGKYTSNVKAASQHLKMNPLKVQLNLIFHDDEKEPTRALIYYKLEDKLFFQIESNFLIKEALFLP